MSVDIDIENRRMDEATRGRASAKGWLTRSEKKLQKIIEQHDKSGEFSKTELVVLLDQFSEKLRIFDTAQNAVECVITDTDELDRDIEISCNFREEKMDTYIRGRELLESFENGNHTHDSGDSMQSVTVPNQGQNNNSTKLPRIELTPFSGDVTEWRTFWDMFGAIIHQSNQPDVTKFTYLRSLLKGDALRCIEGLALTSKNYQCAIEILNQRFGRLECIIFGHIQKLLSIASDKTDRMDLWNLYDIIQSQVRSLENLGIDGQQYGVILTPLILYQLPNNIRLEWAREGEGHEGDLDFLMTFLFNEIRRRERSQTFSATPLNTKPASSHTTTRPESKQRKEEKHRWTRTNSSASSLMATQSRKCVVCQGDHWTDKCSEMRELSLEQRREILIRKGLCFICLGKHLSRDCSKKCYSCKGRHHLILCQKQMNRDSGGTVLKSCAPPVEHDSAHQGMAYARSGDKRTIMQVVKTEINGKMVNVMFDSGADRSFITTSCASKLNLYVVGRENLALSCFGDGKPVIDQKEQRKVYRLNACGKSINLLDIPTICCNMYRCAVPKHVLGMFENVSFWEDYSKGQEIRIDILIGLDFYWTLIGTKRIVSEGLVAQETEFGWMLSGFWTHDNDTTTASRSKVRTMLCKNEPSEDLIRKMWELDSIGIHKEQDSCPEKVLEDFNKEIEFKAEEKRYEIKLPWKGKMKENLMTNEANAKKRLESLSKRLNKNLELKERYDEALISLENEGIIHEIPKDELETNNTVFYLPHRPVVKESSLTTKIRPVFDASAKCENDLSLNDCLETGPNLLPDLIEILIRFRRWQYGLTSDITKAFLQIKVNKIDQDAHRFLWDVNGQKRHMRFDRVIFGNVSSPFLLNATMKFHLSQFEETRTIHELKKNLYMDDWLSGADTEQELLLMISEATQIMEQGGFPLAKWASNNEKARDRFCSYKKIDGLKEETCQKVLGMSWETLEDCFSFEQFDFEPPETLLFTKRMLLSLIARLFDPLGLLTPFTIKLKILFQMAWSMGHEWDQILPFEIQKQITIWIEGLQKIRIWKIPRRLCYKHWQTVNDLELIGFADASEKAYGCCIYLKATEGTQSRVTLVMSRVKVAPLKRITLPRLELMAAVMVARLLKFVKDALCLQGHVKYTCWTDSQITLSWIKGEPHRWKQFVSNRITEIKDLTDSANWKHCKSKENPADLLTRGIEAQKLIESSLWLHGPAWLVNTQSQRSSDEEEFLELSQEHQDSHYLETEQEFMVTTAVNTVPDNTWNFDRFGDFGRLLRVIGWIRRFVHNANAGHSGKRMTDKSLTQDELHDARKTILLGLQSKTYGSEIEDLKKAGVVNRRSPIAKLAPFIGTDGFLRLKGRLELAPGLLYDEKHPILLPKCHLTYLMVKSQHEMMKHAGVTTLITALRNKYWIVSVRTLAKKVCHRCIACQRQDARPYDQIQAPLPADRISRAAPFSVIGVDHAGPLYCKDHSEQKLYILIFTCAVVRAVHLELVNSLSLEDFTLAFRRFSARRGLPTVIYSDNAKTFRGADQYLQKHLGPVTLTWKFNAPRAPWWGGWWERLIRSAKSGLRKSLGMKLVTRSELETVLHEVEACINSRPLTYVGDDKQSLTPSHFLIGRGTPLMTGEITDIVASGNHSINLPLIEKDQQNALDTFWNIWKDEYIRNLPHLNNKKINKDLKEGTLVLVREDGQTRLKWPLGVITKMYPGRDGQIRAVELKTAKGKITRAVQRLHKLEVSEENGQEVEVESGGELSPFSSAKEGEKKVTEDVSVREQSNDFTSSKGRLIKPRRLLDL